MSDASKIVVEDVQRGEVLSSDAMHAFGRAKARLAVALAVERPELLDDANLFEGDE